MLYQNESYLLFWCSAWWDMRRQTAYQILDDMLTVSVAGLCEKTSFLYNFSIDGFNDSPAGFYFF